MSEHIRHEIVDHRFGYVYVSGNGQVVVDTHETDGEHLTASSVRTEQPLHTCRFYLSDVIPKEWIGARGILDVVKNVRGDGKVVSVTCTFTPIDQPTRPNPLT